MIPNFIASIADAIASLFGYDTMVLCRSDRRWTVERISFMRRPAGQPRPTKLRRYRGTALQPGQMMTAVNDGALAGEVELTA